MLEYKFPFGHETVPVLQGKHVILRALTEADAASYHQILSDEVTMKSYGLRVFSTVEDTKAFIAEQKNWFVRQVAIRWGIVSRMNQQVVGDVILWRFDPLRRHAEVGIKIHKDHRRRGLPQEALDTVLAFAFSELGLHSLEANIAVNNRPAQILARTLGFREEGYRRQFHYCQFTDTFIDNVMMNIVKTDWMAKQCLSA